jgi:hypothetical protein
MEPSSVKDILIRGPVGSRRRWRHCRCDRLIDGEAIVCDESGLTVFDLTRSRRSMLPPSHLNRGSSRAGAWRAAVAALASRTPLIPRAQLHIGSLRCEPPKGL